MFASMYCPRYLQPPFEQSKISLKDGQKRQSERCPFAFLLCINSGVGTKAHSWFPCCLSWSMQTHIHRTLSAVNSHCWWTKTCSFHIPTKRKTKKAGKQSKDEREVATFTEEGCRRVNLLLFQDISLYYIRWVQGWANYNPQSSIFNQVTKCGQWAIECKVF